MTYGSHRLELSWGFVFEVVGVGNLPRCPDTLVRWVVNVLWCPLALIVWVALRGSLPFATAGCLLTLGVGYSWRNPIAILLVIPVFGLLGLRVWDHGGLVIKPVIWLGSFLVGNFERGVFIPIFGLLSLWIWDSGLINPVFWLGVLGIINLLLRVDRWCEVVKKVSFL